jgi:hypothetical protein
VESAIEAPGIESYQDDRKIHPSVISCTQLLSADVNREITEVREGDSIDNYLGRPHIFLDFRTTASQSDRINTQTVRPILACLYIRWQR